MKDLETTLNYILNRIDAEIEANDDGAYVDGLKEARTIVMESTTRTNPTDARERKAIIQNAMWPGGRP